MTNEQSATAITVSLEWAKKLKECGWPQDDSHRAYWVPHGARFADGYSGWESHGWNAEGDEECGEISIEEAYLHFVGDAIHGDGSVGFSNTPDNPYKTFPALRVGQYGDDNYREIPLANCFAAPTAEEILQRLPVNELGSQCKDIDSFLTVFPCGERRWQVSYTEEGVGHHIKFDDPSLSNAAAAMYVFLSENNLLPTP